MGLGLPGLHGELLECSLVRDPDSSLSTEPGGFIKLLKPVRNILLRTQSHVLHNPLILLSLIIPNLNITLLLRHLFQIVMK